MDQGHYVALDAQAAAGRLAEVFALDLTKARAVCAGCGAEGPFAGLRLWGGEMGVVLRCAGCDAVVLRYVATPRGLWLEMQGLARLTA